MGILVLAKKSFYQRFLNFIILPFNNKYIFMYNKKEKLFHWFQLFLTIFQLINFSLFIYLVAKALLLKDDYIELDQLYFYPLILFCLILFTLGKVIIQLTNGFIFNNNKLITEFIYKKLSYLNYSALIMLIANIMLAYVTPNSKPVIYLSIVLILLVNSIGWVLLLKNHQKFLANNIFYFILYLCALEIAPFILIGTYLNK